MPQLPCHPAIGVTRAAALFERVAAGQRSGWFLWRPSRQAMAIPTSLASRHQAALHAWVARHPDWPIVTRITGGGAVPLWSGTLILDLAWRMPASEMTLADSYATLCHPIITALTGLGIAVRIGAVAGAFCDGGFNLVVNNRKLGGTAQRWRRLPDGGVAVLAHAAIIDRGDLDSAVSIVDDLHRSVGLGEALHRDRHIRFADLCTAYEETALAVALHHAITMAAATDPVPA
jgi:lipoate-protein ligase A